MSAQRPLAILVHGLWMHGVVMEMQRFFLEQQGFDARCYSYPSVEPTLTENANRLAAFARAQNATALGTTAGGTTVSAGATLDINGVAIGAEGITITGTGVGGVGALTGTGTAISGSRPVTSVSV